MASGGPVFSIMCTSEEHGAVKFDVVGLIASRTDNTGHYFGPTRTYDGAVKWILDEIQRMREESPDLYFIH